MPLQKRATIVQISDLHINRRVDSSVLSQLRAQLAKLKPDILIISGDLANQPVMWQMRRAAREVQKIIDACSPYRTIIIPGNHDFKFWGNVGLRRLTRIPFEIFFRRDGLTKDRKWMRKTIIRLAWDALKVNGTLMQEPPKAHLFPDRKDLGLVVFTINSNTLTQMMAAGKVESRDLQELYRKIDEVNRDPEMAFFYSLLVVHHHPAPIADAPSDSIAQIQDSFMLFYNSGLLIREVSRRRINLLLHGHKHVAGFMRMGCDFEDIGRTTIPVVAAGTASHPSPDDSRGHHFNVITIFKDDTAVLEQRFFSSQVERAPASRFYDLETLEDVRQKRTITLNESEHHRAHTIYKTVQITGDGYSLVKVEYRRVQVTTGHGLKEVRVALATPQPSYLRGVEVSPEAPFDRMIPEQEGLRFAVKRLRLAAERTNRDAPFDYEYCYRVMNGHTLTAEEFRRHYSGTEIENEWVSIRPMVGCEHVVLDVQFPEGFDQDTIDVRAIAEFTEAPINIFDAKAQNSSKTMSHRAETERIALHLEKNQKGYRLTVDGPIPAMAYKISWIFRTRDDLALPPLSETTTADVVVERLLGLVGKDSSEAGLVRCKIQSIMEKLTKRIIETNCDPSEALAVSIMAFDEESKSLKTVWPNAKGKRFLEFYSGEGCAGFAFEKARSVLYHPARDPNGLFIRAKEIFADIDVPDPQVLMCFPLFHTFPGSQFSFILGVVTISTQFKTTRLLQLFDLADRSRKVRQIQDLVTACAAEIVCCIQ